jgi:dipeptidyl aminopeptidase/acylaminoacyl peptidase
MLQFVQNRGGSQSDSLAYWHESIGPHLDPKIVENSPVHAADRVTAPVLIIYSADDTVVAPSQSENMARALKEAGQLDRAGEADGDDHWLSHGNACACAGAGEVPRRTAAPVRFRSGRMAHGA